MKEPDNTTDDLTHHVIGAAIEVHRQLGPGFLESVYHRALCHELALRNIGFICESVVRVTYKSIDVGEGRIDLNVGPNRLIVELKTVESLLPVHEAQLLSYLKATGIHLGLLMNFKSSILKHGLRRVILSQS